MNTQDSVIYELDDLGVARISLNRAEKHNAFDDSMIETLIQTIELAENDSTVRALVLQARGKTFCAGADLGWMQKMAGYTERENEQDAFRLATLMDKLYRFKKPTIARIQGAAFGGAVGLIACCDIAIASKLSKFCLSEVKLGLIPATISPYVIKAMGERTARRYFMTAEVFSSRRARRLGLIHESVSEDELDQSINDILAHILKNGPVAVSAAKSLSHDVASHPINEALLLETSRRIAEIRVSPEGQEGLSAFFDKRKPAWQKVESN